MSSGVEDFADSDAYTIPSLQDILTENSVTVAPTPDGLVSLFTHDLESGDPIPNLFSFQAGSHQEQDYLNPTVHNWRYLGNRSVSLGGRESEAYLFAVDVKQRLGRTRNGSNDHIHEGVTARVLLTEKGTQDDKQSPEAVLSIDNFLNTIEHEMHDRYDPEASQDMAPYAPKRFVAKVPPSLVSALKTKMTATGDADLNRPRAFAIVSDIVDNLKSHFEGSGDVTVSDPWPVPKIQSELELPRDERLDRERPAPESDPEEKMWTEMARQENKRAETIDDGGPSRAELDDDPGCDEDLAAQFEAMKAAKAAKRSRRRMKSKGASLGSIAGPSQG
jgi:hypothetical protein